MYIKNATPQDVYYQISKPGGYSDCGTINAGGTESLPAYDSGYTNLQLFPPQGAPNAYFSLINGPQNAVVTLSLTVTSVSAADKAALDKEAQKK